MKQAIRGIPRAELQRIWDDVKANNARLDACTGPHEFSDVPPERGTLVRYKVCAKCGGRLDKVHAHWYERGLKHGRGS